MKLSELGEEGLIARLTRDLPTNEGVIVGPGDDCAVVGRKSDRVWTLLKTDCVIEGVHFTPETDFARVGWKALARNVSDIVAMGGEPEHALITIAAPSDLEVAKLDALYEGINRCARKFGISIAGGETARSPDGAGKPGSVFISVALTGRVERSHCVTRSGGKPGDALFVTGELGGSITGKHLDFTPRLVEARWLTEHFRLHAMMDISDGIGSDLPRLAKASKCGYEIGNLPCTPGSSQESALSDGEDFELLFAIGARHAARLLREWPFPELPLTRIGRLTPLVDSTQSPIAHGFDHFTHTAGDV